MHLMNKAALVGLLVLRLVDQYELQIASKEHARS